MNDFTKEELKFLWGRLCFLNINQLEGNEHLPNKICDMIDTYCEHEWENICCQCALDKIYCHKCNKDMGDLEQ